jgi:methyl-accepting chemotaxis protein
LLKSVADKAFWYEAILDSVPLPISVTDMDMNWTFINKASENAINGKRTNIIGKSCTNWGASICKTQSCGISCLRNGITQTKFGQGNMHFQVDVAYLTDSGGKKIGHVEIVQDTTKIDSMVKSLNKILGEVKEVSSTVSVEAGNMANSSQELAMGASEQASSIEELNASIDLIGAKTELSAKHASDARELSQQAKDNALKGNQEMQVMLKSMEDIKNASDGISKIIKAIEDIAFQTNLLALNAAVEAARAGEHGKGFAVVAEEVRNLAARSQLSAKETSDLILDSKNKVDEGAKIASNTAETLISIVADFESVSKLIDEMALTTSEQVVSIKQISTGVEQISHITQQNSAASQETAAASQELSSQAEVLKGIVINS